MYMTCWRPSFYLNFITFCVVSRLSKLTVANIAFKWLVVNFNYWLKYRCVTCCILSFVTPYVDSFIENIHTFMCASQLSSSALKIKCASISNCMETFTVPTLYTCASAWCEYAWATVQLMVDREWSFRLWRTPALNPVYYMHRALTLSTPRIVILSMECRVVSKSIWQSFCQSHSKRK